MNAGFRFEDVEALAPYLAALGISHVYLSPILQAAPGSMHGYDGIDPTRISEELGGHAGYEHMTAVLEEHGIGQMLDIVPNHLAATPLNPWWRDVLRQGRESPYAAFFDLRWRADGTVHLPVLGSDVPTAIANEHLRIAAGDNGPELRYFDTAYPLAAGSACEDIDELNRDPTKLTAVLDRQHYRLVDWHETATSIDYRRFFNIDGLVGVREEEQRVFDAMHARVLELLEQGHVQGLRIDHIDGLRRPGAYLRQLQPAAPDTRIVVEKILEGDERLPDAWPVGGTTGYDFLGVVNGLFVHPKAELELTRMYTELTHDDGNYEDVLEESKRLAAIALFGGDLTYLAAQVEEMVPGRWSLDAIVTALREIIVALPVYRTYFDPDWDIGTGMHDPLLLMAIGQARSKPEVDATVMDSLQRVLAEPAGPDEEAFALSFQQFSGPVMAKGSEDTAFYRYNRLIALNEVGANPGKWGTSLEDFHRHCSESAGRWPLTMLATSTHDTKRGEDARLRIAAITEVLNEWAGAVRSWMRRHETLREGGPDANDTYLLYQTLVGAWPIEESRVQEFMLKAVREAKLHTTWTEQNAGYESALSGFITSVLADEVFVGECDALARRLTGIATRSSLAQTLLKLTAPGVPDIYQGTELWDLTLVDPDNRRPVDFQLRARLLDAAKVLRLSEVMERMGEGLPKLWLIWKVLTLRRGRPALFEGSYTPLYPDGPAREHVVAFMRNDSLLTVAPRLTEESDTALAETRLTLPAGSWQDIFTDNQWGTGSHALGALLREFPVALLVKDER